MRKFIAHLFRLAGAGSLFTLAGARRLFLPAAAGQLFLPVGAGRLFLLAGAWWSATSGRADQPAATPQWWNQGDPSPTEQSTLEWINRTRADPIGTLTSLGDASSPDPVLAASWAARAPQTAAQCLANLQSALASAATNAASYPRSAAISGEPLAFYPAFQARAAALRLSTPPASAPQFAAGRGAPDFYPPVPLLSTLLVGPDQSFAGPNATGGSAQFGSYGGNYAELTRANLYDPALSAREWMLAWLCAPGTGSPPPEWLVQGDPLPDLTLGHTRLAGISVDPVSGDSAFFRASSEFLTVSDLPFGTTGTVFITGVAYRDQNSNGQYDAGEGIAGVAITAAPGGWGAVTGTAGGYALPVAANSGPYVLTASGGPWTGTTQSIAALGANVKVDWVLPAVAAAAPAQNPVAGATGEGNLANLSTRGRVEAGAGALIGGFIIGGPADSRLQVLLRGVGPSLQTVGIPTAECIPATTLQLYSGGQLLASDTGWTNTADGGGAVAAAAKQTGAFTLTPWAGGGGDSALLVTLAPGAYSALVAPAPGLPTVYLIQHLGLVEVYVVASTGGASLTNLSSRALTGAGDLTLTLGASLAGTGQQRLLVRGAGPALAQIFGVTPALANPVLTWFDQTGAVLAANDDWGVSAQSVQLAALALSTGAFPFPAGSLDAGLIVRVASGQYTAQLAAKAGTDASGIGLIELYSAP